jgi:hypothetical protein
MRADGTFSVTSFVPTTVVPDPPISTALPVGISHIAKAFDGEITGRSATLFTAAYDQSSGSGTYVAMESFEGTVAGRSGTFNFVHAASTSGADRTGEYFAIVPASGTGDLTGITGTGGLAIDPDGTHRIWFDYEL